MEETGYIYIIQNLTGEGTLEDTVCRSLSRFGLPYACSPTDFEDVTGADAERIKREISLSGIVVIFAPSLFDEDIVEFSVRRAEDAGKPTVLFTNNPEDDLENYSDVDGITVIDASLPEREIFDRLFVKILCGYFDIPEPRSEDADHALLLTARQAVLGDRRAQYLLALEYLDGSLPQSFADAAKLLKPSADAGETDAMRTFANCLIEGKGVTANPRAAYKYLSNAASLGDSMSYICLGDLYSDSEFEGHDPEKAYGCYKSAADAGLGEGYFKLGCCLYSGYGCKKDSLSAFDNFSKGAELGNTDCIYYLGMCCEYGEGCETDATLAVKYYREAANAGNAGAKNNLGGCYLYGFGVPIDPEIAFGLFNEAEQLGNLQACTRAGICLASGVGCEKDEASAVEYYTRAADKNEPVACARLAVCYEKGIGTEQNFGLAFEYYERAALLGDGKAMYRAAQYLLHGRGVKKNTWQAYKWFDSAAQKGLVKALYEVANCQFEGIGTVRNYREAFKKYVAVTKADPHDNMPYFKLGLCHLGGLGTDVSRSEAYLCFKKSAEMGNRDAMLMAGECCFFGIGTEKNFPEAVRYYKTSSELGGITATLALAECLEYGRGVQKDDAAALRLYKKAADADNTEAMYNTGRCIMSGIGTKKDPVGARLYLLRAARKEHITAMLCLGILADEGIGIPKNEDDAMRWYSKAASTATDSDGQGVFSERIREISAREHESKTEAQYRLGMLTAKTKKLTHNYIEAFEYIAGAASMGYLPAEHEIARIYRHGGELKSYFSTVNNTDTEKIITPDKRSVADALNKLGDTYYNGKAILKKNEAAAVRCYRIAAELGQVDAMYSLGWCLRHGAGVKENDVEAVKWLKMSADNGNKNAAFSYGLCCEEGCGTGVKNKRDAIFYYRKAAADGHVEAAKRYSMLMDSRFNNSNS